jgi:hypothetical protein
MLEAMAASPQRSSPRRVERATRHLKKNIFILLKQTGGGHGAVSQDDELIFSFIT